MASFTRGYSFGSTEQVTNSKLHNLVDNASISSIMDADISGSAAIAISKINITAAAINYDRLNLTGKIVNADISSGAAIDGSKLAGINNLSSGAGIIPSANLGSGTANSSTILYGDSVYRSFTTPTFASVAGNYTAGNYLVGLDNQFYGINDQSGHTSPYGPLSSMYIPRSGTLRISFYVISGVGGSPYGQIYRNGSPVGSANSGGLLTQDISGWTSGDSLQLYAWNTNNNDSLVGGVMLSEGTPIIPTVDISVKPPQRTFVNHSGLYDNAPSSVIGNYGDFFVRVGGSSVYLYFKGLGGWVSK